MNLFIRRFHCLFLSLLTNMFSYSIPKQRKIRTLSYTSPVLFISLILIVLRFLDRKEQLLSQFTALNIKHLHFFNLSKHMYAIIAEQEISGAWWIICRITMRLFVLINRLIIEIFHDDPLSLVQRCRTGY